MKILVTGGTGLIGKQLISSLLQKGHVVNNLSRSSSNPQNNTYHWDIEKSFIDPAAFDGVEAIVHLAGAGIADKRWTEDRKKEIIDSRVLPIMLLKKYIIEHQLKLKTFISGSAIGFYGGDTGDVIKNENDLPGNDFLASCTKTWESAAEDLATHLNIRLVKIRTGVVLSKDGGALPKIAAPIKLGFGASLGTGSQWISWIDLHDLVNVFIEALENETWNGPINAVSPNPVSNQELTNSIAKVLGKKIILPNIPSFVLKLLLGEMSTVVLGSSRVSCGFLKSAGFEFIFENASESLEAIYKKEEAK